MDKSINLIKDIIASEDDRIIVGCSGGPDSMCLLDILYKEKYKLICAHINHNIRKESDEELEFLRKFCEERSITFEHLTLPKNEKHNESYYRKKRYEFYKNLADKYDTQYIMTAHHGDDLVETILMRISRGSHLKGYIGFPKYYDEYKYKFIKPLIYYTKEDISRYNETNSVPSVHDYTNDKDIYTRNRYRHHILPFLKGEEENVHLKYLQFSEELSSAHNYIEKVTLNALNENYNNSKVNLKKFLELDEYIQKKELELIFKSIYKDDIYKLKSSHITNILNMIYTGRNFELSLPNNIKIKREYNNMFFTEEKSSPTTYRIELENKTILPNGDIIEKIEESDDNSNYTIRLNTKELKLPLYIRNRKDGDRIEIKNLNGSKKVKSVFIDSKIEPSLRNTYPLLVDGEDNIIWIPGLKKSKFDNKKDEKYDIILRYAKKGNVNEKK